MADTFTFAYPASLTPDEDGRLVVEFRDVPEALTDGANVDEALAEADDALAEAIAGRITDGEQIPVPSSTMKGEVPVRLPPVMSAKAALYAEMRRRRLSKLGLANILGCDEKEVRRMLDPRYATKVNRLETALAAVGLALETRVVPRQQSASGYAPAKP